MKNPALFLPLRRGALVLAAALACALPSGLRAVTPVGAPTPTPKSRYQVSQEQKAKLREMVENKRKEVFEQARIRKALIAKPKATPTPVVTPAPAAPAMNAPNLILMLKPYHQEVDKGKRFFTEVSLYAERKQVVDRIRICIAYPRLAVRPVRIFDYPLGDAIDPDRPSTTSLESGFVQYEARLARPIDVLDHKPLLKIVWEALEASPRAALRLNDRALPSHKHSALFREDENLLESKSTSGKACIGAAVAIASDESPADQYKIWRPGRIADTDRIGDLTVALKIRSSNPGPRKGEEFVLDVLLDNPRFEAFDEVRLAMAFDPAKVEVLDWDYAGWIQRGVNVFDGHAHENYPFNIHTRNRVDNRRGRIHYQMGNTTLGSRPSGCLVRIHCRAKAPGALGSFSLYPNDRSESRFTDIRARGRSILKVPKSVRMQLARMAQSRIRALTDGGAVASF